jgi:hypothetical protein
MSRHDLRHEGRYTSRIDQLRREMQPAQQVAMLLDRPVKMTPRQRLVAAMGRVGLLRR